MGGNWGCRGYSKPRPEPPHHLGALVVISRGRFILLIKQARILKPSIFDYHQLKYCSIYSDFWGKLSSLAAPTYDLDARIFE